MANVINTSVKKNGEWITNVNFKIKSPLSELLKDNGLLKLGERYDAKPTESQVILDAFKNYVDKGGGMADIEIVEVTMSVVELRNVGHSGTAQG